MDRFNSNEDIEHDAKAAQEGASAHADGLKLEDNPYQTRWEWRSWVAGWAEADQVAHPTGVYHGSIRTSEQIARVYLCSCRSRACCILCDTHYLQRRRDGERFWLVANAEAGTPCYTCYPRAERHHTDMAKVQEWLEQRLNATASFADGLPLGDIDDTGTDTTEVDYHPSGGSS